MDLDVHEDYIEYLQNDLKVNALHVVQKNDDVFVFIVTDETYSIIEENEFNSQKEAVIYAMGYRDRVNPKDDNIYLMELDPPYFPSHEDYVRNFQEKVDLWRAEYEAI
ncbi:hypothetical protein [Sutcliffiella sp. NC1]|uniref:hypothetical protein n=1 Tax=Sutcliffiella sp. NC1 TaxID=3004096 RepID=UPI0022DE3295|nr:hypothetical protein [Sutcliffiella sp. NC1]WBL16350.1 hypothetical protein O1A01_06880 [Sutcliffiella sp. NC1]